MENDIKLPVSKSALYSRSFKEKHLSPNIIVDMGGLSCVKVASKNLYTDNLKEVKQLPSKPLEIEMSKVLDKELPFDACFQYGYSIKVKGDDIVDTYYGRVKYDSFKGDQSEGSWHYICEYLMVDYDCKVDGNKVSWESRSAEDIALYDEKLKSIPILKDAFATYKTQNGFRFIFKVNSVEIKTSDVSLGFIPTMTIEDFKRAYSQFIKDKFLPYIEFLPEGCFDGGEGGGSQSPSNPFALSRLPKVCKNNGAVDLRKTVVNYPNKESKYQPCIDLYTQLLSWRYDNNEVSKEDSEKETVEFKAIVPEFTSDEDKTSYDDLYIESIKNCPIINHRLFKGRMSYDSFFGLLVNFRSALKRLSDDHSKKVLDSFIRDYFKGCRGYDSKAESMIKRELYSESTRTPMTIQNIIKGSNCTFEELGIKERKKSKSEDTIKSLLTYWDMDTNSKFKKEHGYNPISKKKDSEDDDEESRGKTLNPITGYEFLAKEVDFLSQIIYFDPLIGDLRTHPDASNILFDRYQGKGDMPIKQIHRSLWIKLGDKNDFSNHLASYMIKKYKFSRAKTLGSLEACIYSYICSRGVVSTLKKFQYNYLFRDGLEKAEQFYLKCKEEGRTFLGMNSTDYLNKGFSEFFGINPTRSDKHRIQYNAFNTKGRAFLLGWVKKMMAFDVGQQVDILPFFIGKNGRTGKNGFINNLITAIFGESYLHNTTISGDLMAEIDELPNSANKDSLTTIEGSIINFLDELPPDMVQKSNQGNLKKSTSRVKTAIRKSYARRNSTIINTAITICSTNLPIIVNDATGGVRRYFDFYLDAVDDDGYYFCELAQKTDEGYVKVRKKEDKEVGNGGIEVNGEANFTYIRYDKEATLLLQCMIGEAYRRGCKGLDIPEYLETIQGKRYKTSLNLKSYKVFDTEDYSGYAIGGEFIDTEDYALHKEDQDFIVKGIQKFQYHNQDDNSYKEYLIEFMEDATDGWGGLGFTAMRNFKNFLLNNKKIGEGKFSPDKHKFALSSEYVIAEGKVLTFKTNIQKKLQGTNTKCYVACINGVECDRNPFLLDMNGLNSKDPLDSIL